MNTNRSALLGTLAAFTLFGCAGGDPEEGMMEDSWDDWSWDAGDGTDDDWASPDAGASPPPSTGGAFCDQLGTYAARCSADECSQAILADCGALTGIVSRSFLDSAGTCLAGTAGLASCMGTAIADMAPTDAHREFAAAFCSECVAIGASTCESSFFDGGDGEAGPAGKLILPLGESVVRRMTEECTSGLTCAAQIQTCTQRILVEEGLPDEVASCLVTSLVGGGEAPSCEGTTDPDDGGPDDGGGTVMCDETYEPNELMVTAEDLGAINDRASFPSGTVATAVTGATDADWFRYDVTDAAFGAVAPRLQLDTVVGAVRFCAFWSCSDERDGEATCGASDSTPETLSLSTRELDGCCAGASGRIDLDINCPGLNDSGTVFVRVEAGAEAAACNTYEYSWGDD